MRPVSSWGHLGAEPHDVVELTDRTAVAAAVTGRSGIAYGLGRSYGDACLNPNGLLWRTAGLDRLISFDEATGRLLIKPGPTDTAMTTHMKQAGQRLASAEDVARATVDAIRRGKVEVYAPKLWRYIMLIVRHMPRPILNRLPI